MMTHLKAVLTAEDLARCRSVLDAAAWVDGKATAGAQSARAKHNLQIDESAAEARELGGLILDRLGRHPAFISAALPLRVYPPLFNRYDEGMGFGGHVDNAVRFSPDSGARYRTDLACTLFLSEPEDYDGGELVVEDAFGPQAIKLPAGDMVLYPASSVHRVETITRGARWASFFWVHSMVRDNGRRALLHTLDQAIISTRGELSDDNRAVIDLTATYHNLLRMWADT